MNRHNWGFVWIPGARKYLSVLRISTGVPTVQQENNSSVDTPTTAIWGLQLARFLLATIFFRDPERIFGRREALNCSYQWKLNHEDLFLQGVTGNTNLRTSGKVPYLIADFCEGKDSSSPFHFSFEKFSPGNVIKAEGWEDCHFTLKYGTLICKGSLTYL